MDGVNDVHTNSLLFFPETSTSMLTNSWLFENLIHWHTLLKTLLVLQFQEKFLSLFINTVFRLIGAQTLQSHVHRLPRTEEIIYRLRPPTKNRLECGKLEIVWKIKHTKAIWIVSVSVKIHFLFASHVSESEHLRWEHATTGRSGNIEFPNNFHTNLKLCTMRSAIKYIQKCINLSKYWHSNEPTEWRNNDKNTSNLIQ